VKGLYRKALNGEVTSFTGVSDPYEPPEAPDVTVDSSVESLEESTAAILDHLREAGLLGQDESEAVA
jgi:adenylylsulfate kinase